MPRPTPWLALILLYPFSSASASASASANPPLPIVVIIWAGPFTAATDAAFLALALASDSNSNSNSSSLDAVHAGCAGCEAARCDGTVGFGGSPDETCETILDALIMDGRTLSVGAVAGLRRIKPAIAVARRVLERTGHSLLAGDPATAFAVQNGFVEEDLSTAESVAECAAWRARGCQPNFRIGDFECAPDSPLSPGSGALTGVSSSSPKDSNMDTGRAHDTLSLIAIDAQGHIAAGTTSNGASHKIPGRVGDAPLPGSASYADSEVGACGATGDGDIMMRFLPCYQAVESMRLGLSPRDAARDAVARMVRRYPGVRASRDGRHAGAGSGWDFRYSWRAGGMERAEVVEVEPLASRTNTDSRGRGNEHEL